MKKWLNMGMALGLLLLVSAGGVKGQAARLNVVASSSILTDVVRNVAGDAADVTGLMPLGADPHSFLPTPRDLVTLADADVVFVVGVNFEESLLASIENAVDPGSPVVVSDCVAILPFGGQPAQDASLSDEDHADGPCADHYAELPPATADLGHVQALGVLHDLDCGDGHHDDAAEDHDVHEAGTCDPHVWMNPRNVMLWTLTIRDTLSQLDPANAERYTANEASYIGQLESLLNDELLPMVETLPAEQRVLVTNHGAFGYFADAFGFEIVGVVFSGGSTLAEASAADVAALIDTIRAQHVPAIFAETTANPELAGRIADETGATVYTLYTGSLSEADGPAATYLDYMRYNTRTIVAALTQ